MSSKKTRYSDSDYKEYMRPYDEFYEKRCKIFKSKGCPKLDSQFSENIAADKVGFKLDHKDGIDGVDANKETYEVKGTGYTNTKVHFSKNKADHVIWVKATPHKVFVYELDNSIYSKTDGNGFINLEGQFVIREICTLDF